MGGTLDMRGWNVGHARLERWTRGHGGGVFRGQRGLVAGAGVTGRPVAAALLAMGATVRVTDANPERLGDFPPRAVRAPGLDTPRAGSDLVVTSPGWRPDNPLLLAAAAKGIEVIGDIE